MNELLFWLTVVIYLIGTGGYIAFIIRQKELSNKIARRTMFVGLCFHTLQIVVSWAELGHVPAVNLTQAFNLFAWAIVAGYLFIVSRVDVKVLGSFVAPLAVFMMLLAGLGQAHQGQALTGFQSIWLSFHVITAFLGDGIFAIAFLAGIMYLLQERELKSKNFGWMYKRLPALITLDNLNRTCLIFGFPLLTLGMLSGVLYAQMITGVYWSWDPKETWSLITWIVYAILVHQRLTVGWQGKRAAIMAIGGFAFILFTFLGSSLLMSGYHDFSFGRFK